MTTSIIKAAIASAHMHPAAVVAVLVAVSLAGCSDGGAPGGQEDPFQDLDDVDVDEDRGLIRGIVVDPTITPVEGATVKVMNEGRNTTTNANGAFVIADLAPGSYFLEISKPGYTTIQSNAEVKGGVKSPPIVKVQIEPLPGTEPRVVPHIWDGYIGCSIRRWNPPAGGVGQSCPYASTIWPEHDFLVDYELDQVPAWVTSDMLWESTQHFGDEMSFNLRRTDTNCDTVDVEGPSPLHLSMTPEDIAEHNDRCNSQGGFGPDMPLRVIIFTADRQDTRPPTGGWGLGLQIEQDFSVYTHVFYNYAPPEEWVFVTDGDPPPPS